MIIKKIVGLLIISVFAMSANASVIRTLISEDAPGTNGSWSFGTIFTVGTNNLNVTSLGAYDYLGDGFRSGSIKVGIFDEVLGTLLVSTNVQSSDPLLDSYRYSAVNLALLAGQQYRLVGVSGSDNYIQGNGTWTFSSDVVFDGYGYCSGTSIQQCNSYTEGDYGMANMQYDTANVPAPASIALLGLALAGLGFSRRKKST
ncbi:PEP-CTERM sorting domain-containing protein [Psychromonas ossibalaenae]|uniref:PEP-CTERM sorting domain-containing protein n=1 Tax=Psychromonas ossibalaenae TaxID=444922 RepID=UPI00035E6CFB|nr:PEP-CTERM sorting domain-containing protein [Psychromonas ossibalaenae]